MGFPTSTNTAQAGWKSLVIIAVPLLMPRLFSGNMTIAGKSTMNESMYFLLNMGIFQCHSLIFRGGYVSLAFGLPLRFLHSGSNMIFPSRFFPAQRLMRCIDFWRHFPGEKWHLSSWNTVPNTQTIWKQPSTICQTLKDSKSHEKILDVWDKFVMSNW